MLRSGKPIEKNALVWGWDWNGFIDASWKTARDTGAVSYMSFDLINAYAAVYLSPSDIQSMLISHAESDATLQDVMKPLDEMYTTAMKNL